MPICHDDYFMFFGRGLVVWPEFYMRSALRLLRYMRLA